MANRTEAASGALVLIVEDDSPIAETLAMIIEDMGYATVVAYNGRDGLAIATGRPLRLIVTDLMMPQMSGKEMIAALRACGRQLPPILMLTAGEFPLAHEVGATRTIAKPFDLNDFQTAVATLLSMTAGE